MGAMPTGIWAESESEMVERVDLAVAAGGVLADGVDAGRAGGANDVDRVATPTLDVDRVIERGGDGIERSDAVGVGLGDEDGREAAGGRECGDADGEVVDRERGLGDATGDQGGRIGEREGVERALGVDGVSLGSIGVDRKVAGIDEDIGRGEHGVASEVDDGEQAGQGRRGRTGVGDSDRVLGRLASGADGANGADDGAILVAAAGDGEDGRERERENGDAREVGAAETFPYWLVHTHVTQSSEQTVLPGRGRFELR